ncbi:hypothetical protein ABK040_002226 [Willaertia magna]
MSLNTTALKQKWNEAKENSLKYINDPNAFKLEKREENIKISTVEHTNGSIVRGDAIIKNCTVEEFLAVISSLDLKQRQNYDQKVKNLSEVDKFSDNDGNFSIRYQLIKSPSMMVSERDFLYIEHTITLEGNVTLFVATSVDDVYGNNDKVPKTSGAVRGTNYFTSFELKQEGNDLVIKYVAQANPNGWIPTSIANSVVLDRPMAIARIAKLLGKTVETVQ